MFQALQPCGGKSVGLQGLSRQDPACCLDDVYCPGTSAQHGNAMLLLQAGQTLFFGKDGRHCASGIKTFWGLVSLL